MQAIWLVDYFDDTNIQNDKKNTELEIQCFFLISVFQLGFEPRTPILKRDVLYLLSY